MKSEIKEEIKIKDEPRSKIKEEKEISDKIIPKTLNQSVNEPQIEKRQEVKERK